MRFEVEDRGLMPYEQAYALQKERVAQVARGESPSTLLLLEHPSVYTFGRRSPEIQTLPGDSVHEVERGGEATFHNPGQLVGYPIFQLTGADRDLHRFLRRLEEALIRALFDFSVEAGRREGATGVWVHNGQRKIASIGVAVSRWVTYHGFALNVCNDLTGFHRISPCGFSAGVMTSLEQTLGKPVTVDEVKPAVLRHLRDVFHSEEASSAINAGSENTSAAFS